MSNWQPTASIETLKARAEVNAQIRDFFQQLDVGAVRKIDQRVVRVVLGSVLHIKTQAFEGANRSFEIVGFV